MRLLLVYLLLATAWIDASDIDAQIAKIQHASPQERYKLVNQLKKQIANLNALEQARSIKSYQQSTQEIQQQALQATQQTMQEALQKEQSNTLFIPSKSTPPDIIPHPTPTIPNTPPSTQPAPIKNTTPTYTAPQYQPPIPSQETPKDAIPTPQPSYDNPSYQVPTPSKTEPKVPVPQPTYEQPTQQEEPSYQAPSTLPQTFSTPSSPKRGGF